MIFTKKHTLFFWCILVIYTLFSFPQHLISRPDTDVSELVINEVMTSNGNGLSDEDGDYPDWIELYNQSDHPLSLAGWSLTDDPDQLDMWRFPDINLEGQSYLIVFASGKNRSAAEAELHTNFKLNRDGEYLALYRVVDDQIKDQLGAAMPAQLRFVSYGRYTDEQSDPGYAYGYSPHPTPGGPNDTSQVWWGIAPEIAFSQQRGFYEAPFSVALSAAQPEATIRYTTDGSTPTESHGQVYTAPISVAETTILRAAAFLPNYVTAAVNTHTYLFLDDVLASEAIDPRVGDDAAYAGELREGLLALPSLSIATDDDNLHIYAKAQSRGRLWERPASVELVYPENAQFNALDNSALQVDAGIRTHGGRGRMRNKISFRLFFRGLYGPATKLQYPLFPDSQIDSFETLVLRAGGNSNYTGTPDQASRTTYTRDEWLRSSQGAMSGVGAHGTFVHLYLNGLYWGLYNIVERPDAAFMAAYYGGEEEDWYVENEDGIVTGSTERIERLRALIEAGDLDQPERYAEIQQYLDISNFIDYVILNWYAGNTDWPHRNWYLAGNNESGQVKHFVWDGEKTWVDDGAAIVWGAEENHTALFLKALLKNADFQMAFADRVYKHLYNGGALTDETSQARWLSLNQSIEQAIVGELARWGVIREEPSAVETGDWLQEPGNQLQQILAATNRWVQGQSGDVWLSKIDWYKAQDKVIEQMADNVERFIKLVRKQGYYPEMDPPAFSQQGGRVEPGYSLSMATPQGIIYYTTDGSDPRQAVSGGINASAKIYGTPLLLTETSYIKARLLLNDSWSALNEAVFQIEQPEHRLAITEIMYNPLGGNDYEYLELKNTGNAIIDLSNMFFEGIDYSFPSGTLLLPDQLLVLVHDPVAFARRYPQTIIGGVYNGRLANEGEQLVLRDAGGNSILTLTYDDENGWPLSSDGRGDSLVIINADADWDDPGNWHASLNLNGSPGADEISVDAEQPISKVRPPIEAATPVAGN